MLRQFDTERRNLTFPHSDRNQRSRSFYPIIWLAMPRRSIVICVHVSIELEITLNYNLYFGIRLKMKTYHGSNIIIQSFFFRLFSMLFLLIGKRGQPFHLLQFTPSPPTGYIRIHETKRKHSRITLDPVYISACVQSQE